MNSLSNSRKAHQQLTSNQQCSDIDQTKFIYKIDSLTPFSSFSTVIYFLVYKQFHRFTVLK